MARGQQQQLANTRTTTTTIEFWAKNISIANTTNAFVAPSLPLPPDNPTAVQSQLQRNREKIALHIKQ